MVEYLSNEREARGKNRTRDLGYRGLMTVNLQCKARLKILVDTADLEDVILPKNGPSYKTEDSCKKRAVSAQLTLCTPNTMKRF